MKELQKDLFKYLPYVEEKVITQMFKDGLITELTARNYCIKKSFDLRLVDYKGYVRKAMLWCAVRYDISEKSVERLIYAKKG